MSGPDVLAVWGPRVAEWAAPHETVLAAQLAHAYAEGGDARRALFRTGGHAPGGIGGELSTVLPEVLDALAHAADVLKALLSSQEFANTVATTALLVSLRGGRSTRGEQQAGDAVAPEEVLRAALRLRERLLAHGVAPDLADDLAARLTTELLDSRDPAGAVAFLDALAAREEPAARVPGRWSAGAVARLFRRHRG
ncbi:hypothetical protein AB0D49_38300 [Streptomyces sp. NPDC048290]|uniref:hypothetical protein n=1 Tax=Streptomyces sp. NPDC048290 TaxID=3155811 RepID=UPI0034489176